MADKTLLFKTDASKEVNTVQTLEPRLILAESLGASTVKEADVRTLARDKDGNLVVNPVLTDILNSEFINVIRKGLDGRLEGDSWVTFASTSNDENGGVDPEHSLLVSLKDLEVSVLIPEDVSSVTTEPTSEVNPDYDPEDPESPETFPIETLCKYYGKKIHLDSPTEQAVLWSLVADRTVRLHKNNGVSVSGKWELDLERIERETPDVLHLHVSPDDELLAIDLDPSKVQTIPVTFTPDDGQDVFKLILFIKPFDLRVEQKQLKISNSTATPDEAKFLRPWVIVSSVSDSVLTGAKGEGGLLKVAGLTNCVKAVDSESGNVVNVTVSVIPTHAGFNTTGVLDSVKLPSVPAVYDSSTQLNNLVEDGLFTVKATVSADGYESQEIDLAVCINAEDQRDYHLTIVLSHEALSLARTLVNGDVEASSDQVSCTSRLGEADEVVDATLVVSGVSGLDGETAKVVTTTIVDKLGADNNLIYVAEKENGSVSGYILVKCECEGYVTETVKLPVSLVDKRLPDGDVKWNIVWGTKPAITIPVTHEGKKGDALEAVVSSLGLADALVATTGTITSSKISDQWGNEEEVDEIVVGVVDGKKPVSPKTVDVVDIPENAYNEIGCWVNVSIVTKSGLLVVKKVQATVTDNRAA